MINIKIYIWSTFDKQLIEKHGGNNVVQDKVIGVGMTQEKLCVLVDNYMT